MKKIVLLLIIFVLILSACYETPTHEEDNESTEYSSIDYDKYVSEDEYFRVTTYVQSEIQRSEPIEIFTTIEYIGEKDKIRVWHNLPNFGYTFVNEKGYESIIINDHYIAYTDFDKGQILTVPVVSPMFIVTHVDTEDYQKYVNEIRVMNDQIEESHIWLPPGEYTIRAECRFSLTKELVEYSNGNEFSIVVE